MRRSGEKCGNLVTLAIDNWTKTGNRILWAEEIIPMTTSGEWTGKLPVCPGEDNSDYVDFYDNSDWC